MMSRKVASSARSCETLIAAGPPAPTRSTGFTISNLGVVYAARADPLKASALTPAAATARKRSTFFIDLSLVGLQGDSANHAGGSLRVLMDSPCRRPSKRVTRRLLQTTNGKRRVDLTGSALSTARAEQAAEGLPETAAIAVELGSRDRVVVGRRRSDRDAGQEEGVVALVEVRRRAQQALPREVAARPPQRVDHRVGEGHPGVVVDVGGAAAAAVRAHDLPVEAYAAVPGPARVRRVLEPGERDRVVGLAPAGARDGDPHHVRLDRDRADVDARPPAEPVQLDEALDDVYRRRQQHEHVGPRAAERR